MNNRAPIEITEAQAKTIFMASPTEPTRQLVMRIGDKWFDIRHLNQAEILAFVAGMTGKSRH